MKPTRAGRVAAGAAAVCRTGEAAEFTCKVKGQVRSRAGNLSGTGNSQASLLHTAEHTGEQAALAAEDGSMLGVKMGWSGAPDHSVRCPSLYGALRGESHPFLTLICLVNF